MKTSIKKILVALTSLLFIFVPAISFAGTEYNLLAPLPCIAGKTVNCTNGTIQNQADFLTYVQFMFNLLIAAAAVTAVIMIIWGGIEYMTSDAWNDKSEGLERVKNAVYGLILVLCSFLILRTIDPRLAEIPSTIVPSVGLGNIQNTSSSFFNQLDGLAGTNTNTPQYNAYAAQKQQTQTALDATQNKIDATEQQRQQAIANNQADVAGELQNQENALKDQAQQQQLDAMKAAVQAGISSSVNDPNAVQNIAQYANNANKAWEDLAPDAQLKLQGDMVISDYKNFYETEVILNQAQNGDLSISGIGKDGLTQADIHSLQEQINEISDPSLKMQAQTQFNAVLGQNDAQMTNVDVTSLSSSDKTNYSDAKSILTRAEQNGYTYVGDETDALMIKSDINKITDPAAKAQLQQEFNKLIKTSSNTQ